MSAILFSTFSILYVFKKVKIKIILEHLKIILFFGCAVSLLLQGLVSLVAVSRGYSLFVGCGLLIVVPSVTLEHSL